MRLSQEAMATALGITFQQVQKYERGANRVSASMLYDISQILGCQAGDLIPPNTTLKDEQSQGEPDWLTTARHLHNRHPRLFEQLAQWPADHLTLFLATTQALRPRPENAARSSCE